MVLSNGGFGDCALFPVLVGPWISTRIAFFCQGSNGGKDFLKEI